MKFAVFANRNSRTLKARILTLMILAAGPAVLCAQSVVTKPDLIGRIHQSGPKLIVTVENAALKNPLNASGKAPSSQANLTLDGQLITIQVPELLPQGEYQKEIPIPASLLDKSFTATLKVDAAGGVVESVETNNTFTKTFNECDLVPVTQIGGRLALSWDNEANPGVYHIKVRNNGVRKSAPTITRITVADRQGQIVQAIPVSTPGIAPGATASLSFNYDGNVCYFTLTAICDFGRVVAESNENNNTAKLTITCED